MTVIAGLGNPGDTYRATRHNLGFETVDRLSRDHGIPVKKRRFRALLGEGRIAGRPVLLVKPQTYMNVSGEALRDLLHFYRIPLSDLIVVYDDVSLPVGDIRVRLQGSAGGHNGVASIIEALRSNQFTRVRIGIGQKPEGWDLADYVLSRFKKYEEDAITAGITHAADAAAAILCEGAAAAMNRYNRRVAKTEDPE